MCAPPRTWSDRRKADPDYVVKNNAIQRERRRVLIAWITAYKRERGCIDCGYRGHESGCDLDLDHTDGKTSSIPHLRSIPAVMAEIERHKCVVRCANCHRIKTYNERKATMNATSTATISDEAREDFANCTTVQDDGSLAPYGDTLITPDLERCIAVGLIRTVNGGHSPPEFTDLGAALARQMVGQ